MRKLGLLITLLLFTAQVFSHPWKPAHYVIIDTDGGIDDFRAISILLSSPDIRVLGITVSPGVLPADDTYNRVKAMLKTYYHEGIPVGLNDGKGISAANFEGAKNFQWGEPGNVSEKLPAVNVVRYIYKNTSDSLHFICLGSLNIFNIAQTIENFKAKTAEIIWSNSDVKKDGSFNYSLDNDAFKKVVKLGIPLKMIDGSSLNPGAFSTGFSEGLEDIPSLYPKEIKRSLDASHKIFYDEIIPLWLHFPAMFNTKAGESVQVISLSKETSGDMVRDAFLKIIAGETINQNQVINFSWRKEDYFPDVQPIMEETIKKYGKAEWIAETMANELHRHLGVFAIVGTKMGIRAKEYFNAGIDEMKILSYAGSIPPFSCMNDGLQVSTGATVGHGLISMSAGSVVRPIADFTYMGRTIRLTLKPEYGKKIASEVKELNQIYGLNSDIYWELIRRLAIKYWANFDRHDIFIIEEISTPLN